MKILEEYKKLIKEQGIFKLSSNSKLEKKLGTKSSVDLYRLFYGDELFNDAYKNNIEIITQPVFNNLYCCFQRELRDISWEICNALEIDFFGDQLKKELKFFKLLEFNS